MQKDWSQRDLERMVRDELEESLTLEYKSADALERTESKKKEITKDVSAMANSAGGTVIYGIKEFDDRAKRHLPEKIDPVARNDYPNEWIEHVISSVRPRIDGLDIHPVTIDTGNNLVVYVVEIPKGATAHQALDRRYYRRYNFESVPMYDHEIRDVMARGQCPRIDVELTLSRAEGSYAGFGFLELVLIYTNVGRVYAQYVNGFLEVPASLLGEAHAEEKSAIRDGVEYKQTMFENIHKDIVDFKGLYPSIPLYVTRYDPLLPGLSRTYTLPLGVTEEHIAKYADLIIWWNIYADNAPPTEGHVRLGNLAFTAQAASQE